MIGGDLNVTINGDTDPEAVAKELGWEPLRRGT